MTAMSSPGGLLAASVVALGDGPFGTPGDLLARLKLPVPAPRIFSVKTRSNELAFPTADGEIKLVMWFENGTWEPPIGNSSPRENAPTVIGVAVTGPNGLAFDAPASSAPLVVDGDGPPRRFTVWDHFAYFEQGTPATPWSLTRWLGRAPFHRTLAEQKALEDALILISHQIAGGATDVQAVLTREFAARAVAPHRYDFAAGTLEAPSATSLKATWTGPTLLTKFFAEQRVTMLVTSFANNAGQRSVPIQLDGFTIHPSRYYIRHPDMQEAEMGDASAARFSELSINVVPGQKRRDTPTGRPPPPT